MRDASIKSPIRSAQSGIVLLSLMLVVLAAASFVLLKGLNEGARKTTGLNQNSTRAILKEAKAALIGYAVSYPERPGVTDRSKGPGRLPCPDYTYFAGGTDNVGQADSCSLGAGTETGLFPFHTIDTNEMFDSSGSRLWYAVSDNHRSNAGGVVNSDTAGTLTVDGKDDIVAIIIAPGPALNGQDRKMTAVADSYNASKYLEAENATSGDNLFTNVRSQFLNDEIITLTRAELMAAVEHRVLSTVNNALNGYFKDPDEDDVAGVDPDCAVVTPDCDDGYPWLAVFSDPSLSNFEATVGNREGHLPVVAIGRPFSTTLNFDWNIPSDGTYTNTSTFDPFNTCARVASCDIGGGVMTQLPIGDVGATCTWAGTRSLNCSTVEIIDLGGGDRLEREYVFEFSGIPLTIDAASATTRRNLDYVVNNGRLPASVTSARITLNDNKLVNGGGSVASGNVTLELAAGDEVTLLSLRNVGFELEVDHDGVIYPQVAAADESTSPGELPEWLFEDAWHHLIVVSYAEAEQADDLDANCTVDGSCFTVEWDRYGDKPDTEIQNVRGVAIVAGRDLNGARPSASLADYFEGQNASFGDTVYAKGDGVSNFNDQLKVLNPDE